MTKRKSMSDEQLYALIRESRPRVESLPAVAAERVLSEILASDRNEAKRARHVEQARPRRKVVRAGTLAVGAVLVMSGSALAAGSALGVIELGGGDTAETLATVPITYQSTNGKSYQVNVPSGAPYTYRLAGGQPTLHCADTELYVESNRQLSPEELHQLLLEESAGPTHVRSDTLPDGVLGIGESCIPDHQPAGAANAQAEAKAEGLTAEKWREQKMHELRATGAPGPFDLEGLNRNHELGQAEAAEVEEAVAAREAATGRELTQAEATEVVEEAVAAREAAAAGRNEPEPGR